MLAPLFLFIKIFSQCLPAALIGERTSQLRRSMNEIEENIDGKAMGPRTINFPMREPTPSATLTKNNVASPSATLGANRVASPATTPTQDDSV